MAKPQLIGKYVVRDYPQTDNNNWEPAGHYVLILCNNETEAKDLIEHLKEKEKGTT